MFHLVDILGYTETGNQRFEYHWSTILTHTKEQLREIGNYVKVGILFLNESRVLATGTN